MCACVRAVCGQLVCGVRGMGACLGVQVGDSGDEGPPPSQTPSSSATEFREQLSSLVDDGAKDEEIEAIAGALVAAVEADHAIRHRPGMYTCLLYTSPSPRDATLSRMPSSA